MNRIIAGTFLEKDGKYLLIKENGTSAKGKWWIPAGSVDDKESIEEAAIRETYEECGYNVKLNSILCIYNKVLPNADPLIGIIYRAGIIDGEIHFDTKEIADAKWFSYDEILSINDNLRNSKPILKCIQNLKTGNELPLDTILKL